MLESELEQCKTRRILAWDELEEYEKAKAIEIDGLDIKNILIERAKADIELLDLLIVSLEGIATGDHPLPK